MKQVTGIAFFLLLQAGCVEMVELEKQADYPTKLVIEGEISNLMPPYYFKLFKSAPLNAAYYEGVDDAILIVSDNEGLRDTLQPLEKEISSSRYGDVCHYYYMDNAGDSIRLGYKYKNHEDPLSVFDGYFRSRETVGTPGNIYTLEIIYQGNRYITSEKMEEVPMVTRFDICYVPHQKEGEQLTPFIDFLNPRGRQNYYMFSFARSSFQNLVGNDSPSNWPYSIANGKDMPEIVTDFQVNDGETLKGYSDNLWYPFNEFDSATIRVSAISESYFNFMSGQIDHLRADGGAYMPTPGNLKGNFGNNVMGYFRVISVCEKKTLYQEVRN